MRSKWFDLKPKAIQLRQKGTSLRSIEATLNIPKSTLSGWFKNIILKAEHQKKLKEDWTKALCIARQKAVIWHNQQKILREQVAKKQAQEILALIKVQNIEIIELALAMLYLGEGNKIKGTVLGNSNPLILKFFINALKIIYNLDTCKIRGELHLRSDQNPLKEKVFWSKALNIPQKSITSVSIDKRTSNKPTYDNYHGVCVLRCGNIAIQRRLIYLANLFCAKLTNKRAVSSAGRASA